MAALLLWAVACQASAAATLVSIKPLQLLAIAVTGSDADVELLIDPQQSHHEYQLRPSDRQRLQRAQVIFWVGPNLETFLVQPLAVVPDTARVVAFDATPASAHGHGHDDHAHGDAHLWLDPQQAVGIARRMMEVLAQVEPARRPEFERRLQDFAEALGQVDREIGAALAALPAHRPYMVLHDAYGHFEHHYGLRRTATYSLTPERAPGARHLLAIQKQLDSGAIQCVFREPQFAPRALAPMLNRPGLHSRELDLMAAAAPATPDGFVNFYRAFGQAVVECLAP